MSGVSLEFTNNTIQVFAYERFNFRIPNPNPATRTLQVSNDPAFGINPSPLYFTNNGNIDISFSVSDLSNNLVGGTSGTFRVTASDASTSLVSANNVTIGPGRFLDGSGQTLSNRTFTFFKNEPITPGTIRLVAPSFTLQTPITNPTLPPGFGFASNASNIFDVVGTPTIPTAGRGYQVIGVEAGGSKLITTNINIVVSNERLRTPLSGEPIISAMAVGAAIDPRTITAIVPTLGGSSTVRYTFDRQLPDGFFLQDASGTTYSPAPTTFTPSNDLSFTMIIGGTPTLAAARAFADAQVDSNGLVFTITATRTFPLPQVSNTINLTLQFAPAVLFDTPTIDPIYVGVPVTVTSNTNFFQAFTYFITKQKISNISSIFSPDLRADLSLIYAPGSSRADLSGTDPTLPTETANYIIRAISDTALERDLSVPITVVNDSITFDTPPTPIDVCYNFILSRPASLAKTGFYPSNIQFKARAASGRSVVLSAPALGGTGLSLDASGLLVGTPTEVIPLSTLSVTASAVGSPATATRDVSFAILNDIFTFADVPASSLEFIQNIRITDVGFPVTTLSERNVIGYSQTGFPSGLSINSAGVVSGTPISASPTAGNVTINATTGFASGSRDFSYNVTPDAVLLFSPVSTLNLVAGQLIGPIRIEGVSYSGKTVSNYQFVDLSETYGLTIGSNSGILNGTLGNGFPPEPIFPVDSNFQIKALAGDVSAALDVRFQTINPYINRSFVALQTVVVDTTEAVNSSIYFSDNLSNWTLLDGPIGGVPITDFRVNYTNPNSNEINYLQYANPPSIQRYTNGPGFTGVGDSSLMRAFTTDGSGTWWAVVNARMETDFGLPSTPNPSDGPDGGDGGIAPSGPPLSTSFIGNIAKSEDNGVTWIDLSDIPGQGAAGTIVYSPRVVSEGIEYTSHPYRTLGISLRYKDDVLLLGGGTRETDPSNAGAISSALMRSVNNGATWTSPTTFQEVAGFNLDDNNVWLAYGSSLYATNTTYSPPPSLDAVTIKYSTNQGANWSDASNASLFFTYDITYGNGVWIATGLSKEESGFTRDIRFSSNGSNWQSIDLSTNPLFSTVFLNPVPPIGVGPTMFNGTSWNVFVTRPLDLSSASPDIRTELYTHDADTDLSGNWTAIDLSGSFPDIPAVEFTSNFNSRLFLGFTPDNLIKQTTDPIPFLTFTTGTGPTFTAPTTTSYLQFQYIPIPTIQISATGVGQVYFFVTAADLPPGLSFNPITAQITGAPVQIGTVSFTVFAKDDNGASQLVISFTTVIPRIIRKQDGAAAYTSLLRQYTEVLAAQSARDSRALPTEMRTLGEFMSPVPPPVITPSNCPC